ncbi:plastidic phosphate translocator [Volvox carteri f. nagariensis]|uniref:Plastidic phosphate translocator n=1 Tax=Volvox carteri f. nagariensis TaxID=3068 RepID=D8TNJ8_VOLCA|nr:plastidic phosphate translocator [Volvox carteri f. nagariensis]EFJ50855.1 plastidic phosphate translocator [Volvox carteri f. nagariensis]|eukprot:XP_002947867.1 plastidic phosphate translocator [Volvox carteri f. nagariensis]
MSGGAVITSQPASFLVTSLAILSWYCSNIGVLILNKYLLSSTGFHYPVFLTLCHMLASLSIGLLASVSQVLPLKPIKSRQQAYKIVILSAVFCTTVVLGNVSLKFIPVSFNQAIGATTPFFTAILAYLMQGQKEAALTYYSLIPIMGGVIVASGGEPLFSVIGFTCCLIATSLRALKSVLQSLLMTDPSEKLDPMSLLVYMSGVSVAILLPLTAVLEQASWQAAMDLVAKSSGFLYWLLGNSSLAYFVNLTNFLVTKYTSPLTLQVLGNAKGVVAAAVSVAVFRNVVTGQGALGYAITVAGVFMYSESKRRAKMAAAAAARNEGGALKAGIQEREPLLSGASAASEKPDLYFRGTERV